MERITFLLVREKLNGFIINNMESINWNLVLVETIRTFNSNHGTSYTVVFSSEGKNTTVIIENKYPKLLIVGVKHKGSDINKVWKLTYDSFIGYLALAKTNHDLKDGIKSRTEDFVPVVSTVDLVSHIKENNA